MFLRATRVQTPPERVDEAIKNFETNVVKGLRSAPGNQGAVLVVNRQSGSGMGITYWESAKALAASEQIGTQSRTQTTKAVPGSQIVNVERAEVLIMDRTAAPKAGAFIRLTTVNGDPDKQDRAITQLRSDVLPLLKAQKGYRATIASVDRLSGRVAVSTVWDTKADLDASESKLAGPRTEIARTAGAGPNDIQVEIFETAVVELSAAAQPASSARA
jgi:heme-degrading monooxygenase HmoA